MQAFLKKIIVLVIIAPGIYLALAWNSLPEKVAMHFDAHGNVNGYGSKMDLLLLTAVLSVVNAAIYLLISNIYRIDPKRNAGDNKPRFKRMAFAISIFMAAVTCLIIYGSAHDNMKLGTRLILASIGLLFTFIGNYMHTIKPNYFAGIRLPWTLENEENWRKTHLLAGKLWFAGGLLITICCLLLPLVLAFGSFFVIMIPLVLIPCIYSYRLYKVNKQETIDNRQS